MIKQKYPWIFPIYKRIVNQYVKKVLRSSNIINAFEGTGCFFLVWNISKRILCKQSTKMFSCNACYSCKLMLSNNHPDFFLINFKKENLVCDKDEFSFVSDLLYKTSSQNKEKIFFFDNIEKLSVSTINLLLNMIETLPKNTFFFIKNSFFHNISSIFRGYCFEYNLYCSMHDKKIVQWLQKKVNYSSEICLTMLKVSNGSPLIALKMFEKDLFEKREEFYDVLSLSFEKKNFFSLFFLFDRNNFSMLIVWICSTLIDSIKIKYLSKRNLTNIDKLLCIKKISSQCSFNSLRSSVLSWFKCKYNIENIPGINFNVFISNELIKWEETLFLCS